MSKLYCGMDLHSNNTVVALLDEEDRVVFQKRLINRLDKILEALRQVGGNDIEGVVVESTYNWYWLVDGLMDNGYKLHLANTAAIKQYEGLKYGDDESDARWLAHLLRLGILPEGYIYPKKWRAVRDLLRKRGHLVRQNTANLLSIQNLVTRNTGRQLSANGVKRLKDEYVDEILPNEDLALAVKSSVAVMQCLKTQRRILEKTIKTRVKLRKEFKGLLGVDGIGDILALTIMLETGDIGRFNSVGNYASYARCVGSIRLSNNKRKGAGNKKNGNKYLSWAFVEAANFAVRYNPKVKRYYQRKRTKTLPVVAIKAVAHKLARACYYIMRDQVEFDVDKAFS